MNEDPSFCISIKCPKYENIYNEKSKTMISHKGIVASDIDAISLAWRIVGAHNAGIARCAYVNLFYLGTLQTAISFFSLSKEGVMPGICFLPILCETFSTWSLTKL